MRVLVCAWGFGKMDTGWILNLDLWRNEDIAMEGYISSRWLFISQRSCLDPGSHAFCRMAEARIICAEKISSVESCRESPSEKPIACLFRGRRRYLSSRCTLSFKPRNL